jgi:hypothetical protein
MSVGVIYRWPVSRLRGINTSMTISFLSDEKIRDGTLRRRSEQLMRGIVGQLQSLAWNLESSVSLVTGNLFCCRRR